MRPDRLIAVSLVLLLSSPPGLFAQQQAAPAAATAASASDLKIVVVQGEGSRNDIRQKTAQPLVLKVVDSADKPVSGAEVVLQTPYSGPSGRFFDWLQVQTLKTDDQGMVKAQGFTPNDELGRWHMKVVAQKGSQQVTALVPQVNITPTGSEAPGKSRKALWIALGVAGAAAAGIAIAVASGGSSTAAVATRPVVIGSGPVTVGGPR